MISFIGMLAAMVSMAMAACSLALAVVVYRRTRGSNTSRQERQETVQASPAAVVPATVVVAGGGAVDRATGRPLTTPCWFSRLVAPLDAWSACLVASYLCAVGERLLSGRVSVGCWPRAGQCRGSLLVMCRLVRLLPLLAVWVGRRLPPCQAEAAGRGPPARNARLLSLIAAAITPINQKTGG